MKMVSINGKNFKELTLREKISAILTLIALPVILLAALVILFIVLGAAFAGIAGLLAIILLPVAVIVITALVAAIPVAIFRKIKRGFMRHER